MKTRAACLAFLLAFGIPSRATAGPNAGGVILLHTNDTLVYCQGNTAYCGDFNLTDCESADNSVAADGTRIFWAVAAFPSGSSPRLSGVTFGINYSEIVTVVAQGMCGDFELTNYGWPASGGSAAVIWNSARTTLLTPIYWFAGYDGDGGSHPDAFHITAHPGGGANFADDSVPAMLDPVAGFGSLGFGATGTTVCPGEPQPTGACCAHDGSCIITSIIYCNGEWMGPSSSCSPNPCVPVPPTTGACCFTDGTCVLTTEVECGGTYFGDDAPCTPNPCVAGCSGLMAVRRQNAPASKPVPATWPNGEGRRLPGRNRDGTLILHTNPSLVYTSEVESYCGESNLTRCDIARTRVDGDGIAIIHAIAAFPTGSDPRMAGVVFGITYGPCVVIEDWGACGNFELPTAGWPSSGEGTAVTWMLTQTSSLNEVYWFAAYVTAGSVDLLSLAPHPTQGAVFADDNVPSRLDPIAALGALGFNRPGTLPCPVVGQPIGACCYADGSCEMTIRAECTGNYLGDDVPCVPNHCTPAPVYGACCYQDGSCQVVTPDQCGAEAGTYQGDDTTCSPTLCPPPEPLGACCLPGGVCQGWRQSECDDNGGLYIGDNIECTPNPCPLPPVYGACCLLTGECVLTTQSDCTAEYQGDNTVCDPNPCPLPVPTERKSWGSIKRQYR